MDKTKSDNWKPIIPNIDPHSYSKGYMFGFVYAFLIVLVTILIDGITAIQIVTTSIHDIFGENLPLIVQTLITISSYLISLIFITIIHELLHVICFPKFWARGNLQIIISLTKGILINNRGTSMTKARAIFSVGFPFAVLSIALFIVSLFTSGSITTSLLRICALLNLLISSFDLRTIFYLGKLPTNALIKDGNYTLQKP